MSSMCRSNYGIMTTLKYCITNDIRVVPKATNTRTLYVYFICTYKCMLKQL